MNISELNYLNVKTALINMGGSEDIYESIIRKFLSMHNEMVQDLRKSYADKDFDMYRIKAHALKSTAATIGATELSEHAKKHEFAVKEDNPAYIDEDKDNLIKEYDDLIEKLKQSFGENEVTSADSAKDAIEEGKLSRCIHEIITLIDDFEVEEAQDRIEKLLTYDMSNDQNEQVKKALELMEDFEYTDAALRLEELLEQ